MENDKIQESDLSALGVPIQEDEQPTEGENKLILRRTVSEYVDKTSTTTECQCECEGCSIVTKFLGL